VKILIVHNHYRYSGGEDVVVNAEIDMLRKAGHEVIFYERHNSAYDKLSAFRKACFILRDVFWSPSTFKDISGILSSKKPDVVHVHNIFFFVSPSVYDACLRAKIPVIQTIHNYRMLCANGLLFRGGRPCEDCFKTAGLSAIRHKCLRGSLLFSVLYFLLLKWIRFSGVLRRKVNLFIAPSEFTRSKFVNTLSIDPARIVIKPNFTVNHQPRTMVGGYVLFAGAIADYKGIKTLLTAWEGLDIPLKVVGNGPLFPELRSKYDGHIEWLGAKSWAETMEYICHSAFVVVPSECYETFSKIIIDAYACAVPVLAGNIGAVGERVIDGQTGILFKAGNPHDLKDKAQILFQNKSMNMAMGQNAYRLFQEKYQEEQNSSELVKICDSLIKKANACE
jgi:glycosyltransferase involved in cell wall biosynthesis